ESGYADFRHPSKVKFVSMPAHDANRRDFTMNALFFDPKINGVFDYVGGLKDLRAKKIRFVGDPHKRIVEDPLRMLRAVRFAATLGFAIPAKDFAAIKKSAQLIQKISGKRIKDELDKIIQHENFLDGIILLEKSG